MITINHTAGCMMANAVYFLKWEKACRACSGTGTFAGAPSAVIEHGVISDGVRTIRASCDRCIGYYDEYGITPHCPRCAAVNKDWSNAATRKNACINCGWSHGDQAGDFAPSSNCDCSEFAKDTTVPAGAGKIYGAGKKK